MPGVSGAAAIETDFQNENHPRPIRDQKAAADELPSWPGAKTGHSSTILKSMLKQLGGLAIPLVILCGVNSGGAQFAKSKKRSAKNSGFDDLSSMTRPQLLNPDSDPTLRYPILNMSGSSIFSLSYGWLDVNREGIYYTVVQPEKKKNEGYQAAFNDLGEIKLQRNFPECRDVKKREKIFYLREDRWGSIHARPGLMN